MKRLLGSGGRSGRTSQAPGDSPRGLGSDAAGAAQLLVVGSPPPDLTSPDTPLFGEIVVHDPEATPDRALDGCAPSDLHLPFGDDRFDFVVLCEDACAGSAARALELMRESHRIARVAVFRGGPSDESLQRALTWASAPTFVAELERRIEDRSDDLRDLREENRRLRDELREKTFEVTLVKRINLELESSIEAHDPRAKGSGDPAEPFAGDLQGRTL